MPGEPVEWLIRHHPKESLQYYLFGNVVNGKIEIERGSSAAPQMSAYLRGLILLDPKDQAARLRYCFDDLEHDQVVIAGDAYREFEKAPVAILASAARRVPPQKLWRCLGSKRTSSSKLGMYGLLLGLQGEEDAPLLRKVLDRDPPSSQLERLVAAYALLAPDAGCAYASRLTTDVKTEFLKRFAVLKAVRLLSEIRPRVLRESELLEIIAPMLEQEDAADLAIEQLSSWQRWDQAERVLALAGKKGFNQPIIQRSILRYALQCPGKKAARYVEAMRREDPTWVKDVEAILELDKPQPPPKEPSPAVLPK